jgi:hypothetical protein
MGTKKISGIAIFVGTFFPLNVGFTRTTHIYTLCITLIKRDSKDFYNVTKDFNYK